MIPEYAKKIRYYITAEENFRKYESDYWLNEMKSTREWLLRHVSELEERENDKLQLKLF